MLKIENYRKYIDLSDDAIILLLIERFKATKLIGKEKQKNAIETNSELEITDEQRENDIRTRLKAKFRERQNANSRDDQFVDDIMSVIFQHSKHCQYHD